MRSVLVLAMLCIAATTAQAQYGDSMAIPWNNPVSATLSTNVWNNYLVYQAQQRQAHGAAGSSTSGSGTASSSPAEQPRAHFDEASLRFRPTGTHLVTNRVADTVGKTQAQKDQVVAMLNAIFVEFDKQATKLGKPNDLAFALSYFVAQNATVFRGRPDPKDEQFLDLRETVVAAMAQSGSSFRNMTNRDKQELYETLVSYTGLVYLGYQDALRRGAREEIRTYRELAALNLKNITHLEPERIDFTADGLTIRQQ